MDAAFSFATLVYSAAKHNNNTSKVAAIILISD